MKVFSLVVLAGRTCAHEFLDDLLSVGWEQVHAQLVKCVLNAFMAGVGVGEQCRGRR